MIGFVIIQCLKVDLWRRIDEEKNLNGHCLAVPGIEMNVLCRFCYCTIGNSSSGGGESLPKMRQTVVLHTGLLVGRINMCSRLSGGKRNRMWVKKLFGHSHSFKRLLDMMMMTFGCRDEGLC